MIPRIVPYNMASKSATSLSNYFGTPKVFYNRRFVPSDEDVLINWGVSEPITILNGHGTLLNKPEAVALASDKLRTFSKLTELQVPTLRFTTHNTVAKDWIRESKTVYCRTLTRGSQGRGIVIARTENELVPASLYTLGIMNSKEYRVHVFCGDVIDIIRKKKMTDDKIRELGLDPRNLSSDIRNLNKGWVFGRDGVNPPPSVLDLAKKAVLALGLDFGAVDIILDKTNNKPYVLEVNTAIGMREGLTAHKKYVEAIARKCGRRFDKHAYHERYGEPTDL